MASSANPCDGAWQHCTDAMQYPGQISCTNRTNHGKKRFVSYVVRTQCGGGNDEFVRTKKCNIRNINLNIHKYCAGQTRANRDCCPLLTFLVSSCALVVEANPSCQMKIDGIGLLPRSKCQNLFACLSIDGYLLFFCIPSLPP